MLTLVITSMCNSDTLYIDNPCYEVTRLYESVVSLGGFQRFLETSQAPTIVYSTVQLASYSLGAKGSELTL